MSEVDARKNAGLSVAHDTHETQVPASKAGGMSKKLAPEHKKGLELYHNEDTRSNLGEMGSRGTSDSKKTAGGTFGGSVNHAEGHPRLTEKVLGEKQKKAKDYATRSENGHADPSAGTQC